MPTGQELTNMPMAVAISLPANQSVTILDIRTLRMTPPMPANRRPPICISQLGDSAIMTPPQTISTSPNTTAGLSPKRLPILPPGSASTMPGDR